VLKKPVVGTHRVAYRGCRFDNHNLKRMTIIMSNDKKKFSPESGSTRREFLEEIRSGLGFHDTRATCRAAGIFGPSARTPVGLANHLRPERFRPSDEELFLPSFDASRWHPIPWMPVTVVQPSEDAGGYKDLYFGMNLTQNVPADLWKQDWRSSLETRFRVAGTVASDWVIALFISTPPFPKGLAGR
jgi:hypothetical protein